MMRRAKTAARWLIGGAARAWYRGRVVTVHGEAGVPFAFRPSEYPRFLLGLGRVDPDLLAEWAGILQPSDVIFDVGANIGFTVQRMFGILGGQCRTWAFEPMPRNLELLRENLSRLDPDRVTIVPAAVGDSCGKALFADNLGHGALSRLASTVDAATNSMWPLYWRNRADIEVSMITLDAFVRDHPEAVPTFVKIDVEGAGASVLRGAIGLIERRKPVIACEFHSESEKVEMQSILKTRGYRAVVINDASRPSCSASNDETRLYVHQSDPRLPGS